MERTPFSAACRAPRSAPSRMGGGTLARTGAHHCRVDPLSGFLVQELSARHGIRVLFAIIGPWQRRSPAGEPRRAAGGGRGAPAVHPAPPGDVRTAACWPTCRAARRLRMPRIPRSCATPVGLDMILSLTDTILRTSVSTDSTCSASTDEPSVAATKRLLRTLARGSRSDPRGAGESHRPPGGRDMGGTIDQRGPASDRRACDRVRARNLARSAAARRC